jgi:phasin family protein
MGSLQDHVSREAQDQIASHLDTGEMLLDKAIDGVQEMAELNLSLVSATLEQINFAARQLMLARDARHFVSLASAQAQPTARRALDYGYYLTTILCGLQAAVIQIASALIADSSRKLIERAEEFGKGATLK